MYYGVVCCCVPNVQLHLLPSPYSTIYPCSYFHSAHPALLYLTFPATAAALLQDNLRIIIHRALKMSGVKLSKRVKTDLYNNFSDQFEFVPPGKSPSHGPLTLNNTGYFSVVFARLLRVVYRFYLCACGCACMHVRIHEYIWIFEYVWIRANTCTDIKELTTMSSHLNIIDYSDGMALYYVRNCIIYMTFNILAFSRLLSISYPPIF